VGDRVAVPVGCGPRRGHALEDGVVIDVECTGVLGEGEGDGAGEDGVGFQDDTDPITTHPHTSDALRPVQAHEAVHFTHTKSPRECAL
jgi:hypothetical protein